MARSRWPDLARPGGPGRDFYGRASYATISGVLALLLTAARALAPVGASTLRTGLDSYAPVMGTVATASALAAAMMLLAQRTQQRAIPTAHT
jgi:hypothetical protein